MLEALRFVKGAVSKKNLLPALTHFAIENGFVRSYNGTIALCSPIPISFDCKPCAVPFMRAIAQCNEVAQLHMTDTGKLRVRSGNFRVLIDCITEPTPHTMPEGDIVYVDGALLLQAFKALEPLIGNDASRPWSNGILFDKSCAYVTNNVVAVQYWINCQLPRRVNVPQMAIAEILRIGEPPTHVQLSDHSLTFHYEGGRWVYTNLLSLEWPDIDKLLEREANPVPFPKDIFRALEAVKGFADKEGIVHFSQGRVSTSAGETEGSEYDVPELNCTGIYSIEMFQLLEPIANKIDLSLYPAPCLFYGDSIRGAIVGRRG